MTLNFSLFRILKFLNIKIQAKHSKTPIKETIKDFKSYIIEIAVKIAMLRVTNKLFKVSRL